LGKQFAQADALTVIGCLAQLFRIYPSQEIVTAGSTFLPNRPSDPNSMKSETRIH
jgi:hypothetical protein